ncbi:MAG: hypothetical protein HPY54_06040 [Chthonomonadetes bacterium]|nr:hypothetical protein [Chthonomonadetes bacterium]
MMELVAALCVITTGIAWLGTYTRARRRGYLDLVDWFVATAGLLYGAAYIFVLFATERGDNPLWQHTIRPYRSFYWLPPVLGTMVVVAVWAGSALASAHIRQVRRACDSPLLNRQSPYRLTAWFALVAGILSYWLYARAYGGFITLWLYVMIPSQRAAVNFWQMENPFTFLNRFGALTWFAALLFFGLVLSQRSSPKRHITDSIGLIIALPVALFILSTWTARVFVASFFFLFIIAYLYWRRISLHWFVTAILALFCIGTVTVWGVTVVLDPFKLEQNFLTFYAKEASFPTMSFFGAIEREDYRYFSDLIATPLHFLPQRILYGVLGLETASDVNTRWFLGERKGEGDVGYGIPVDFLTFGYMQAGVAGIVINGLLAGYLLSLLSCLVNSLSLSGVRSALYAYCSVMVAALSVAYTDPAHIVRRNLHFFLGFAVLSLLSILGKSETRGGSSP